jgi:hypothetical protein
MQLDSQKTQTKAWPDADYTVKDVAQISKTSVRSTWGCIAAGTDIARTQAIAAGES